MRDFHVEQNLAALKQAALKPFAVPIGLARKLLGEKARSQIYEAIGAGKLTAIKDNRKTLITLASKRTWPRCRGQQSKRHHAAVANEKRPARLRARRIQGQ
jgi:hypothetical protein